MKGRVTLFVSFLLCASGQIISSESNFSDAHSIVSTINTLSIDLYHQASQEGNKIFSPYSIATILSMLWMGARGTTRNRLKEVLHYHRANLDDNLITESIRSIQSRLNHRRHYELVTANGIFISRQYQILTKYKNDLEIYYNATGEIIDFSNNTAVDAVNAWIAETTDHKIERVISNKPSPNTLMVLVNAIKFKGTWLRQFDKKKTRMSTFYNLGKIPKRVPMMYQKKKTPYGYDIDLDAFVLELEYGDGVSMYMVLPRDRLGFQQIEANLTSTKLNELLQHMYENEVEITVPKFKMDEEYNLVSALKSMGAGDIFDSSKADFSGISNGEGLSVSSMVHRSTIDVNEEGSEASAATAVVVETLSLKPSFYADHPFFFFIHDNLTGMILFMGRVIEF